MNRNNFFFGDNISQLSVPANYYYNNNFDTLYLPSEITTGHQPFFGMYLALGWKFLGKSIPITHWLLLPFVFGTAYQFLKFIIFFSKKRTSSYLIFLICILDSVLISQLSLLTFEIPHIFFFIATLNALLRKEKLWTSIFFTGLCLVSLRATMSAIGIVLFYFLYEIFVLKKFNFKNYSVFISGILAFITFLFTFYYDHGWIIHNTVSNNWENSGKLTNFKGVLWNFGILFWRLIDLGRIIFWILSLIIVHQIFKFKKIDKNFSTIFLIAITQFLVFFAVIIPSENFITHRYLLPFSIVFEVVVCYWFINFLPKQKIFIFYIFLFVLIGYIWVYPEKISKGWDAMPAHVSYYRLRNDAVDYLEKNNIAIEKTGSSFPNLNTFENTTLVPSQKKFKEIDLENDDYILYSNVFNESDEVIDTLHSQNFKKIFSEKEGFVEVAIYKNLKK